MLKEVTAAELVVGETYVVDIRGSGHDGVYLGNEMDHYCFLVSGSYITMLENEVSSRVHFRIFE